MPIDRVSKVVEIRRWRNLRVKQTHPTGGSNRQGDHAMKNDSDTAALLYCPMRRAMIKSRIGCERLSALRSRRFSNRTWPHFRATATSARRSGLVGYNVQSASRYPSWSIAAWCVEAETIHRLTKNDLQISRSADEVATEAIDMIADRLMISDGRKAGDSRAVKNLTDLGLRRDGTAAL